MKIFGLKFFEKDDIKSCGCGCGCSIDGGPNIGEIWNYVSADPFFAPAEVVIVDKIAGYVRYNLLTGTTPMSMSIKSFITVYKKGRLNGNG